MVSLALRSHCQEAVCTDDNDLEMISVQEDVKTSDQLLGSDFQGFSKISRNQS